MMWDEEWHDRFIDQSNDKDKIIEQAKLNFKSASAPYRVFVQNKITGEIEYYAEKGPCGTYIIESKKKGGHQNDT